MTKKEQIEDLESRIERALDLLSFSDWSFFKMGGGPDEETLWEAIVEAKRILNGED